MITYEQMTASELIQLRNTEQLFNGPQPVVQIRKGEQYACRVAIIGVRVYITAFKKHDGEIYCRTDMVQGGKTIRNQGGLTASTEIKEDIRLNKINKSLLSI